MQRTPELALHRFGFGLRPGDTLPSDPVGWLKGQIKRQPEPASFAQFPSAHETLTNEPDLKKIGKAKRGEYGRGILKMLNLALSERLALAVSGDTPFHERLVWFWTNHFAIPIAANTRVASLLFDFERTAIRPFATGKFVDMLLATARAPAMLYVLNNAKSIGPNSSFGQRRERGLNENYAREVMELHTVGLNGGYKQDDIIELAKILTGWTVAPAKRLEQGKTFVFLPQWHEPGEKVVMGVRYPEEGEQEGVKALTALANHPSTAKYLARKFATHFTSDKPDESLVAALEKSFLDTGGDLGALAHTLIDHDAAWAPSLAKARSPEIYVAAAARTIWAKNPPDSDSRVKLIETTARFGQPPCQPPSVKGFPDDSAAWLGPDQVLDRVDWAIEMAEETRSTVNPIEIAQGVLGSLMSETTRKSIAGAPTPQEGLALVLVSPEFMRR